MSPDLSVLHVMHAALPLNFSAARGADCAYRLGGDELALPAPETEAAAAVVLWKDADAATQRGPGSVLVDSVKQTDCRAAPNRVVLLQLALTSATAGA